MKKSISGRIFGRLYCHAVEVLICRISKGLVLIVVYAYLSPRHRKYGAGKTAAQPLIAGHPVFVMMSAQAGIPVAILIAVIR